VTDNLKAAAFRANLTASQKKQIDGLSKLLTTHKGLMSLPTVDAQATFKNLPQTQQNAMVALMGGEDDPIEEKRSILGNAAHYLSIGVKETVGRGLAALTDVSDFMTRLYRTGAIALDQNVNLSKAFDIANDKGDKVFSPGRIANAKTKYGSDRVDIAIQVASGTPLEEIISKGSEAQKLIASQAAQKKDLLFQDALDAVQAAKYSPGRQIANLLTPEQLEGSGALYKGISGFFDAAYRFFADPTIILGKAKKAYDAGDFLLYNVLGKEKYTYGRNLESMFGNQANIDRVFADKRVTTLFDEYGANLEKLSSARKAADPIAMEEAARSLRRIAPEFGPAAIDEFINAGVKNAETTKNFLQNTVDMKSIIMGQAARRAPLVPRLDAARKARINFFTATDKVFNIDKVGQKVVKALYGASPQLEDVATGLTQRAEDIAQYETQVGRLFVKGKGKDGAMRMPLDQIQGRLDRFARKFTTIPYFKNGMFDPMADDAPTQIYRLARLANSRYHSRVIEQVFAAGDEGQRRQIFKGLYNTVFEIRGLSKSTGGQPFINKFNNVGRKQQYSPTIIMRSKNDLGEDVIERFSPSNFDGEQLAIKDWQIAQGISAPSVADIDRYAARSGIIDRVMGVSHQDWANKTISNWSVATLAGPRFPIRNAGEDLGLHLLAGEGLFGFVKGQVIARKYAAARGDMGFINRIFARNVAKKYERQISDEVAKGNIRAARDVTARAATESKFVNYFDDEIGNDIAELVKYGNADTFLGDLSEGSINALRGSDRYLQITDDVEQFGRVGAIKVDGKAYTSAYGKSFTDIDPLASDESLMSLYTLLGIEAKSDFSQIVVKNLVEGDLAANKKAVDALRNYLDELPTKELNKFEAISKKGVTTQVLAERNVQDILNLLSRRDGSFNKDLLNLIRFADDKGDEVFTASALTMDDLRRLADNDSVPEFIVGPTMIPVPDSDKFTVSFTEKIWDMMGKANARLSRHGLGLDAYAKVRKDMRASGLEQHIIQQVTKGLTGEALEKAAGNARRYIVEMAQDMSVSRVLAFVDNPSVRSQLAMSSRNFARFYRATEDFYRRVYRTVKYNPESIQRAALTYEGVAHSGFVQTDDNGDEYFFYPGLTPVYKVMNKVATIFGAPEAFKAPMPIEFGGKLKMITPSMNPDSLFPTFAGPLAALPLKLVFKAVPQLDSIERALLGEYGEDQPLINAVFPGHVNRLLAYLDRDERSSQYASAFRKAATYLESAGYGLEIKTDPVTGKQIPPSPGEIDEYQKRVQSSTLTVLSLRFLFGFAAPASPQLTLKSEMSKWVRDNERTSYKTVFNQLLQQYNGDIDKTTKEWIRLFPDQMPYTVSESDRTTVALVRSVNDASKWMEENKSLVEKYPQGAPFLIPQVGDFDFDAYRMLFNTGLKTNKNISDFLREVQTAKDVQYYYAQKDNFEAQLATTYGDDNKKMLRQQWQLWSDQYKGVRPLLTEELGAGANRQIERLNAYKDLKSMLTDPNISTQPKTRSLLAQMSREYDAYINARDSIRGYSETEDNYRALLKGNIKSRLKELASQNANAQMAYDVLFARLIGE
jgi:hypothetical protein